MAWQPASTSSVAALYGHHQPESGFVMLTVSFADPDLGGYLWPRPHRLASRPTDLPKKGLAHPALRLVVSIHRHAARFDRASPLVDLVPDESLPVSRDRR